MLAQGVRRPRGGADHGMELGAGLPTDRSVDRSTDTDCPRIQLLLGDLFEIAPRSVALVGDQGVAVIEFGESIDRQFDGAGRELEGQAVVGEGLTGPHSWCEAQAEGRTDVLSVHSDCGHQSFSLFDAQRHHL